MNRHLDHSIPRICSGLFFVFAALPIVGASLLLPARTSAQAAGPGSDSPKNLPGLPIKPDGPPALPPAVTDPQAQAVLQRLQSEGAIHPATLDQWRTTYQALSQFAGTPEKVLHVENRNIPGPAGEIPIRIYKPSESAGLPVWVFFHGGGFVTGSLDTHDVPLRYIANRCDCLVVSVAYRLAPRSSFPAALDDGYAALKWVGDHAAEIGGDPNRLALGGDGAGGNVAAGVALKARDQKGPHLVAQLLMYPPLDLTMLSASRILSHDPVLTQDAMLLATAAYLPVTTDPENPYVSPAYEKNLAGLPPLSLFTAEGDPALDEDQHYVAQCKGAGLSARVLRYPIAIHGFFLMGGALDQARHALDDVAATLKQSFAAGA